MGVVAADGQGSVGIECLATEQVIEPPCAELRPCAASRRGSFDSSAATRGAYGAAALDLCGRVARDGTAQRATDDSSTLVDAVAVEKERAESPPAQRLLRRARHPASPELGARDASEAAARSSAACGVRGPAESVSIQVVQRDRVPARSRALRRLLPTDFLYK